MRIAVICDIHSNLEALLSVIDDINSLSVDHLFVGGDVIPGPQPAECLDVLMRLQIPATFIRGNGEREVLTLIDGGEINVPSAFLPSMRWVGEQLSAEQLSEIRCWPATAGMNIPGAGHVLFCHATPMNDVDIFTELTPEPWLVGSFEHVDSDVVVCGHTHLQFARRIRGKSVMNAGSVGMPFDGPDAGWLLFDGDRWEFQRTAYDRSLAAQSICETSDPAREFFVEQFLRSIPNRDHWLQMYETAARKRWSSSDIT